METIQNGEQIKPTCLTYEIHGYEEEPTVEVEGTPARRIHLSYYSSASEPILVDTVENLSPGQVIPDEFTEETFHQYKLRIYREEGRKVTKDYFGIESKAAND